MSLKHKAIVFTDFDGTITHRDSNDYLTDNIGYGYARRREMNLEVLNGRKSFRDAFDNMLQSVSVEKSLKECIELLLENIELDPGFVTFFSWCLENDIPVVVLSSGMEPVIRALLTKLVGPTTEKIEIVANNVDIKSDGSWKIIFRDNSHFGHDKSLAIKRYHLVREKLPISERPFLVYCGDGVSDVSAARETDLLFAKVGQDLITYCQRDGVPFKVFSDFKDIHRDIQAVVDGKKTIAQLVEEGEKEVA